MPYLQSLQLDAPSSVILDLLAHLPCLVALETRYRLSRKIPAPVRRSAPLSRLRELSVHVVHDRINGLWDWLPELIPYSSSLQSLTIHSRAKPGFCGAFSVSGHFLKRLGELHRSSLKKILFFNLEMAPRDIDFICTAFPLLEALSFSSGVGQVSASRSSRLPRLQ